MQSGSMGKIKYLWREPLVHFLLIGVALFLTFEFVREQDDNAPNRIVVDASQVEQLAAQFKRTWLRPPTENELSWLIQRYVRDEVYYREALAMGLDQNDPMVRQRMRLKLEFLLEDLSAEEAPSDAELIGYLQQHPEDFQLKPQISFRQIYLNPDQHRDLATAAERMLTRLDEGALPDAIGDPTLLSEEYTLATPSEIARSFGEAFAQEVVALQPGAWTGPVYSGLGSHLVKVTERVDERLPELAEIRHQVEREYGAQRRQALKDIAYQKLREGYEVIIEPTTPSRNELDEAVAEMRTE